MTPILIIAGVLAGLILFRWARTLLIFCVAAAAVWFFMTHAHAQKPDEIAEATEIQHQFCGSHSSTACGLYLRDSYVCLTLSGYAQTSLMSYRASRKAGMTSRQAIDQSVPSRTPMGYEIAELASTMRDDVTPDEFRRTVKFSCLRKIAQE